MEYNLLLDLATDLGYRLAMSGAETFRVEESINRLLSAYGIPSETFAIPNCVTVSILTETGKPITRMRRIGVHGNDLDSVEKYNNLCRRICREKPEVSTAMKWLEEVDRARVVYSLPVVLLGCFLGAGGFAIFFGGSMLDALCSGFCGILVGLINRLCERLNVNPFFSTIAAAFIMAVPAYLMGSVGICRNSDAVIIGALMILVPGLLFTNGMRDIIFGDTNSGINRIAQVFMIAAAIALGTGLGRGVANSLYPIPASPSPLSHSFFIMAAASFIACTGFFILFNIHGPGGYLCAVGGVLCYAVYSLSLHLGCSLFLACLYASIASAIYSEVMARVRKYPAISYLVVSIFPLIPGAGIYYASNFIAMGDMDSFTRKSSETISIAGALAVGILLVSTCVRIWMTVRQHKHS